MVRTKALLSCGLAAVLWGWTGVALAQPPATKIFCDVYPDAPACAKGSTECSTCHDAVPGRNAFGRTVEKHLAPGEPRPLATETFVAGLPEALATAEGEDSDGDGVTNREEIRSGSAPGDAGSKPATEACTPSVVGRYRLCTYDAAYVLRKVYLDFCGRSATMAEQAELQSAADPRAHVHKVLDTCLKSENWRGKDGVVWNLANRKIRPSASIKSGKDAGPVPLGDYEDDYALFVYTQIDNHDARDLLLARYFVERIDGPPTIYETFDRSPVQDYIQRGQDGAQVVDRDHRAGMITTRWFLVAFTMFTPLPRTSAAQAYRAYLGRDLAMQEGIVPIAGEPFDYDAKGVKAPECASCHATLDPLTYPFSRYGGLDSLKWISKTLTAYWTERLSQFPEADTTELANTPEAGAILGQPVANLVEWAEVAANSPEFAETLVMNYWREFFGGPPTAEEMPTFAELALRLRTIHNYGIERMLHDLIDTEVYGVP
ncbi:MAG: hypothetical protein RMJ98_15445 [Myxococcales bacterium]|nr:hypothetical protein [Polyangiaceae bacterium]MDW8250689.1 hypothetical protein [Myxococcales bacterium]